MKSKIVPLYLKIFIFTGVAILLNACAPENTEQNGNLSGTRFSPKADDAITLLRTDDTASQIENPVAFPPLRKQLPESVTVFNVLQQDLNNDQFEEQIVAFKQTKGTDDQISILVYSSDIRFEDVLFEWQAETKASELRSFVIRFEDIDADRYLEIICTGIDTLGYHTIDVFKPYVSPERVGTAYYSVLSLTSPLGIDIQEDTRNETQSPISIVHYDSNTDDDAHSLDKIETVYAWNRNRNRYMAAETTTLSGVEQEKLDHGMLANYSSTSLAALLSGLWQSGSERILFFELSENSMVLSRKEIQEWYTVITAYKTIRNTYPSLRITMRNDLLLGVQSNIYISFIDTATVEVFSDIESESNGIYKRIDANQRDENSLAGLFLQRSPVQKISHDKLVGIYKNSRGDELYLDKNSFIFTYDGVVNQGNYTVYTLSRLILEIMYIDAESQKLAGKKFAILPAQEGGAITKIELIPIRLNAHGISFLGEQPIVLDRQD